MKQLVHSLPFKIYLTKFDFKKKEHYNYTWILSYLILQESLEEASFEQIL